MRLFADRFLVDDESALDLASGVRVRLTIDKAAARTVIRDREALCSELAGIRHPLLLPIVDFGLAEGSWFEAHTASAPLRSARRETSDAALHLVRFMRAGGISLSGEMAARYVRPAIGACPAAWRPVGVRLIWRRSVDAVRGVMEAAGPPGVTRVTVGGPAGSGLRTARMILSRAARLAGFIPIDRSVAEWMRSDPRVMPVSTLVTERHLCVIDWLSYDRTLPAPLSIAVAASNRRHLWIRFCRERATGDGCAALERLTTPELRAMIYQDAELGPDDDEIEAAIGRVDGSPGRLIQLLTSARGARAAAIWVHEVAPAYLGTGTPAHVPLPPHSRRDAGVSRLARAVEAARALVRRGRHARAERLFGRASEALAARGAGDRAADAACDLGELRLARGRPRDALEAFAGARRWAVDARVMRRTLIGTARAMRDAATLVDAEAPLRSLIAAETPDALDVEARRLLADLRLLGDDIDGAWQAIEPIAKAEEERGGPTNGTPSGHGLDVRTIAILVEIHRRRGDLARAARLASEACRLASPQDHLSTCDAQLAALATHAELGNVVAVHHAGERALQAARLAHSPVLRVYAAAMLSAALADCGEPPPSARVDRLRRAASKLPPLHALRVQAMLSHQSRVDGPAATRSAVDLFESFTELLHDAGSDTAALAAIASRLTEILSAASVRILSSSPRRTIASAGRDWHDDRVANRVLDGSTTEFRDGVAPEAVVAIRAGGSTIGCLAVRWVTGTAPSPERVQQILRLAAAACAPLVREIEPRRAPAAPGPHPDDLFGCGSTADRLRDEIRRASLAPYPVLVQGESGSGKELVARAIHAHSSRRARRFCAVNCAALTEDLLEAELFGHTRGAFTGATTERPGLFEEADGGTLFLDEIGELSPRAQAKLLRVLQEGEVRRVGENLSRKVDARIVAATNRRLAEEVDAGRFRADLRFRLDVLRLQIPPLRERPDEVAGLAERIWSEAAARVGTRATLSPDLLAALARYDWPGNVRELQNVMAALAVQAPRRGRVPASLLPPHVANLVTRSPIDFDAARLEFERRFVRAALARAGGHKRAAAAQLGVSRQGLAKMMKRLGITEL
jgi:DNA-binding NtrC family response regulator